MKFFCKRDKWLSTQWGRQYLQFKWSCLWFQCTTMILYDQPATWIIFSFPYWNTNMKHLTWNISFSNGFYLCSCLKIAWKSKVLKIARNIPMTPLERVLGESLFQLFLFLFLTHLPASLYQHFNWFKCVIRILVVPSLLLFAMIHFVFNYHTSGCDPEFLVSTCL